MTTAEVILSVFMGVLTLLVTCAIPWAFWISCRVVRIDTTISNGLSEEVQQHGKRLHKIEINCTRNHPGTEPESGPGMVEG